jgi:mono/diheme cytochrome c family protein
MIMRSTTPVLLVILTLTPAIRSAGAQSPPPGKAPYDRVCSVCHGADAHGDAGPRLVPLEHDLDEVTMIVREGRGQMPPVAPERLSDEEIKQIFTYLQALEPGSTPGPK